MSLVEEYYELNESKDVSAIWKILQIGFYIIAGCLGLASGFTLGILRHKFGNRCYLCTEVKVSSKGGKIDHANISWGGDMACDYYQFSMVCSFVVGIIWATLFLMCGKGGKSLTGLPQPWRIVWPSLLFNLIYFVIALLTAIYIQQGTHHFCALYGFYKRIHKKLLIEKCETLKLLVKNEELNVTSIQIEIVLTTAWGCVISWLVLFLLSFFRIVFVVDFRLHKICVFKIDDTVQNKTEEVIKITNYEEPRKLYYDKDEGKMSFFESDEILEDVETGTRKRVKLGKNLTTHDYGVIHHTTIRQNPGFYVTRDIRMLRKKKHDKSPKPLNEAFGRNNLRGELRKATNIRSHLNFSAKSDISKFLYAYTENLYIVEDNETEISSFPTSQRSEFHIEWSESDSEDENFEDPMNSSSLMKTKKHL